MLPDLLTQTETYAIQFFVDHLSPDFTYHNREHTQEVVQAVDQMARFYKLSESDYTTVMVAAWLHDLGNLTGPSGGHEERSVGLAADFLTKLGVSTEIIRNVQACIRATKMPQSPTNRLEEILCDADLFHLGSEDYPDYQKRLRKEQENRTGLEISGKVWRQQNISLLESHRYFTDYAQEKLAAGQAENLRQLLEKQAEKATGKEAKQEKNSPKEHTVVAEKPASDTVEPPMSDPLSWKEPKEKKKEKDKRSERGIETMFRTTSTNHMRLSEIADSKANIMISVNSIMVSVLVSILPRRIEENPYLMVPTTLFLITSVLTIVFAILTTRPNVSHGTFSHSDIEQGKGNLLFFGNFYQMSLGEYEWGIQQLMNDSTYLYNSMARDIYYLGLVLARKYKLLRVAYNIFMFGFIISILAFLVVFFIKK
ncbi:MULTISPECIES: Pycsar system effector family protein [unclassified Spirosoma]|uniref:Pycsar system effector family protein n=1 Tax=unclassified Spirosoma TaxID=2621999 RepID=UPI000965D5A4|nr:MULTISPECIES: Pycsar system effector family protein [unclassified Spirosoma]MBN8822613.1 HD domain-containing protein [Spirosoma sp.]OJW74105.1 MAG: phosphohydrolase [Spirosoma sp. 48-14]